MSWGKHYQRTTKPEPYDEVTFCGICGIEIYVTRGGYSDPILLEYQAREHLRIYHRVRFWLWRKCGEPVGRPGRWLVAGLGA